MKESQLKQYMPYLDIKNFKYCGKAKVIHIKSTCKTHT